MRQRFLVGVFCVLFVVLTAGVLLALEMTLNVSWDRNAEPDMDHYVLARAVEDTVTWTEFTVAHPAVGDTVYFSEVFDETFSGKRVWYKCAAVDSAGNSSAFCSPVSTVLPDVVVPSVPEGMKIIVTVTVIVD